MKPATPWTLALMLVLAPAALTGCGETDPPSSSSSSNSSSSSSSSSNTDDNNLSDNDQTQDTQRDPFNPEHAQPGDQADPNHPPQTELVSNADDPLPGWKTYEHALGATFRYPPNWTVQETTAGVVLAPDDALAGQEMIVVTGTQVQGQTDPTSPQVAARMDQLVASMMPSLRRSQSPEPVQTRHGQAALYRYQGNTFDNKTVQGMVYFAVKDDIALGLTLLAEPSRIGDRAEVVQTIFSTLGMRAQQASTPGAEAGRGGASTDDPRLIGRFRGEVLNNNTEIYINTQLVYIFNPDGTFYSGAQSHFNGSERDYNQNIIWSVNESTDGSVQRGRWSARNGIVTIVWDGGGRSVFAYNFEPDGTLAARDAVTRKLINIYHRM
ncbi:MAG: hypothetical protein AAGC44_09665 [Planctomycetota bacterium]